MEPARQRAIALALAAVALVLAAVATVVVIVRSGGSASTPQQATIAVDDRDVAYDLMKSLARYDAFVDAGNGVKGARLKDADETVKLGLKPDDTIVGIAGRKVDDATTARLAMYGITLRLDRVTTAYVELVRAGQPLLARWHVIGAPPPPAPSDPLGSSRPPVLPSAPDPLADSVKEIDDTHVEIPRATVDKVIADPSGLNKMVRVVPAMNLGKPDGFKLYAIRYGSFIQRLHFANGDTVEAVNGMPLNTLDHALEAFTKLRTATKLDFAIMRRGVPMSLFVAIK